MDNDYRCRMESESSVGDDFDGMEPMSFDDLFISYTNFNQEPNKGDSNDSDSSPNEDPKVNLFSVAMSLRRKEKGCNVMPLELRPKTRSTKNWLKAVNLIKDRADPWEEFHLDELKVEKAVRHHYSALNKTWSTEEVVVKMGNTSFAAGAMRECFRMKKLSNFSQNQDWARDSNNYVAKSYMDASVSKEIYFEDVKLQMDAKLWGEEFNRHNPPKKIDIFMMSVLEMIERPDKPLFHIEHYIAGEYVKYNSNSGYVDNHLVRQTPHAFSHFTFERSGHEMIVVDVQGVGDLYTDPQIHTSDGVEYGDGNLGVKGMALFFHSHECNAICQSLGLAKFDLAPKEVDEIKSGSSTGVKSNSQTILRGQELLVETPSESDRADHFGNFFRMRSISHMSVGSSTSNDLDENGTNGITNGTNRSTTDSNDKSTTDSIGSNEDDQNHTKSFKRQPTTGSLHNDQDIKSFQDNLEKKAKPSNLSSELNNHHDTSILGQVHLALATYHEICRFTDNGTYDHEVALFHLKAAAECGIISAIISVARMYFGLSHDILSEVTLEHEDVEKLSKGLDYMKMAAQAMERSALVFMAQSYEFGINGADLDLDQSLYWYESVIALDKEEGCDTEDMSLDSPPYIVIAKTAHLWLAGNLKQGRDPKKAGDLYNEAAEVAMNCMKGKMANKYYMLAEEAYGEAEDE